MVCGLAAFAVTGLMATSAQAATMTNPVVSGAPTSNASGNAFHVVTSGVTELRVAAPALSLGTYTRSFDVYFAPLPDPIVGDTWWELGSDYRLNSFYSVKDTGKGTPNSAAGQWCHFSQTFR